MEQIWAPWRIEYIQMEKPEECILCGKPKQNNDELNQILYRGNKNFVMMNTYPYNPGHLLVAPYRHLGQLEDLTDEESVEHFNLVKLGVKLVTNVMGPHAFNTGMNLGKVGGAGLADHIHSHIVPRWQGDTNFMPVLADTKILPEALLSTYKRLKEGMQGLL